VPSLTAVPAEGFVLCVGRLYSDLVFTGLDAMPEPGREHFARDVTLVPGGGAFITAAHLAGLGRPAALAARIGIDHFGRGLDGPLAASGVDLRWLDRAADAGPQLTVAMAVGGDRAFLTRRAGKAEPETLDSALTSGSAVHMHIAELATLREIPDLAHRARRQGLTVSLDCSWDQAAIDDPGTLRLLDGIDLFLPNEDEAMALTGAETVDAALAFLTARIPVVAVKLGAKGAVAQAGKNVSRTAAPAVPVVDTTGAGDAFDASFLDRWLAKAPLDSCLAWGVACGSLSVQQPGGACPARRVAIEALAVDLQATAAIAAA
jgi:sugar/nucleoside kinase (ribokinase family)